MLVLIFKINKEGAYINVLKNCPLLLKKERETKKRHHVQKDFSSSVINAWTKSLHVVSDIRIN